MNFSVELAPDNPRGLGLINPVMTASGTFGYGMEFADLFDIQRLGAVVCKGTTLGPRPGNPQPRLVETASGMLNSIGLENIGVGALIEEKAPVWSGWRVPVVVNIAGDSVEEYAELAARLDGVEGIGALEVNISCPNVRKGGLEFGSNPGAAAEVTAAVRASTTLPVMVKLSPNVADIAEIAVAVAGAGADCISLINTLRGMAVDTGRRRPLLGAVTGGLSGPAIKAVALYMVYTVCGAVRVPVVGCGGIASATDAVEFLLAGASAVQVGSVGFAQPRLALEVVEGIESFMAEAGVGDIKELRGQARGNA